MDTAQTPNSDVEADGYYGGDEAETDELDLSFLDEEEDDDAKNDAKGAEAKS